ncbi:response regulator transcription factor [Parabacteroides pacaensis]|uniref:response regulator transcription factor n=1 Tax=Parabacteroides pacaensis TaxID=2086575 RepID=UPI000D111649|nr:LuxR C-terminal-related transcriptional regulator [Parabacteroides pacaensis]
MPHSNKKIAIIIEDTLESLGLQNLLTSYFSPVEISAYATFTSFIESGSDVYDYYFTTSEQFILNADFFLPRKNKTVVLVTTKSIPVVSTSFSNFLTVSSSQEIIIDQLQTLLATENSGSFTNEGNKDLSSREIEVLQLIVKGAINKEIADRLSISLNTVLSHRKNITAKLGIKTVSGLTFYAIMNGYISTEDIEL